MVTNFEDITTQLKPHQRKVLPDLIKVISPHSAGNEITSYNVLKGLARKGHLIEDTTLRKMINIIRKEGLFPVMSNSKGYYTSTDPVEIEKQIQSLEDRAKGILNAAHGLRKFIPENPSNQLSLFN